MRNQRKDKVAQQQIKRIARGRGDRGLLLSARAGRSGSIQTGYTSYSYAPAAPFVVPNSAKPYFDAIDVLGTDRIIGAKMVERRKPLILFSTRDIISSVLSSANSGTEGNDGRATAWSCASLRLTAGIFRFSGGGIGGSELHESSHLVRVSSSVLKRLSVTTGSLVSHNRQETSIIGEAESITVEMDDFMKVLGELSPSLSIAELKKYEQLRDQFEGSLK